MRWTSDHASHAEKPVNVKRPKPAIACERPMIASVPILVAERPGLGSPCDPGFEQVSDISALLLGDGRKPRQRRPCSSIKTRDVADRENLRTPRHRAVRLPLVMFFTSEDLCFKAISPLALQASTSKEGVCATAKDEVAATINIAS